MSEPVFRAADEDPSERRRDPARNLAVVVYLLQAFSLFTGGVTAFIAVIVNYVKQSEVAHTWVEPHFHWQIRTFWLGLLWSVIGTLTIPIVVGFFILLGAGIWMVYRVVKGALALNDGRSP